MLSPDTLKQMRARAEASLLDDSGISRALANHVIELIEELERVRQIHREEQRRSADRLKACLESKS